MMETTSEIKMIKPFDAHVHLRRGKMLGLVLHYTTRQFGEAVIIPNTNPPILTGEDAQMYKGEIISALPYRRNFNPLMTIQITPNTTPLMIADAKYMGVIAGKLYPKGVTTNSENGFGIGDLQSKKTRAVFKEMQIVKMILSIHGELSGENISPLDREKFFIGLNFLEWLADNFPNLKVVLEHLSTMEAVDRIKALPDNFGATITPHHLLLTCDDVLELAEVKFPHNYCRPVANLFHDRKALIEAATSGNPKFFLGTDSAPHELEKKECADPAAGIFNAPVALPLLQQIFEKQGVPELLLDFAAVNGRRFYGLALPVNLLGLVKKAWEVPQQYDSIVNEDRSIVVVPFMAGEKLEWQLG